MILRVLFNALWQRGCVLISTSNRAPDELYYNGINRDVFMPFIGDLKQHCIIQAITAGQDHRLLSTVEHGVYHTPLNDKSAEALQEDIQAARSGI